MKENHETEVSQQYELKAIALKQKIARVNLRIEHNKKVLAVEGPIEETSRQEFKNDLKKLETLAKEMQKKREEEKKKYSLERQNGSANLDKQCEKEIESITLDAEENTKALIAERQQQKKEKISQQQADLKTRRSRFFKPVTVSPEVVPQSTQISKKGKSKH